MTTRHKTESIAAGLLFTLVVSISIPLYFNTSSLRLNLISILLDKEPERYFESGLNIHFGIVPIVMAAVLVFVSFWHQKSIRFRPEAPVVLALIFFFTVSFLVGQFAFGSSLSFLFFVQTIIPVFAFFVGAYWPAKVGTILRASKLLVLANAFSLLIIYSFLIKGLQTNLFVGIADFARDIAIIIPQFKVYYPCVFAVSLSINIALLRAAAGRKEHLLWGAVLAIHALFPPLSWSRSGLILMGIVVAVHLAVYVFSPVRTGSAAVARVVVSLVAVAVATVLAFIVISASAIQERLSARDVIARSDAKRIELALEASTLLLESPLVGRMFIPEWGYATDGRKREVKRLFGAHNQYLDYGLRGGMGALACTLVILLISGWRNYRRLRQDPSGDERQFLRFAWLAILIAVFFGNFAQLYLVQSYTGSIIWFLIGVMSRINGPRLTVCKPEVLARLNIRTA